MTEAAGSGTTSGNNIPGGFTGGASGTPSGAPNVPSTNRARIGEFGQFSANSGEFAGQGAADVQQRSVVADRNRSFSEPFGGFTDNASVEQTALSRTNQSDQLAELESEQGDDFGADETGNVLDSESARAEQAQRYQQWEEWERSDNLAEPLQAKLIPVVVNGERYRVSVAEAANGYMMQSDYSEKLRILHEEKALVAAEKRGINNFLAALDNGNTFIEMMQLMGKTKGFQEAAIIYGTELDAMQRMTPEQREAVNREREATQRAKQLELELRRLQAQIAEREQPTQSRSAQQIENQLKQMVPLAIQRLAKAGYQWEPSAWTQDIWEKHWANMLPALDGKDLSTEHVYNVFMAAIQDIRRQTAAGHVQAPRQLASQQLPPVSNMSGAVQPGQPGGRARRERIGSLGSMVVRR